MRCNIQNPFAELYHATSDSWLANLMSSSYGKTLINPKKGTVPKFDTQTNRSLVLWCALHPLIWMSHSTKHHWGHFGTFMWVCLNMGHLQWNMLGWLMIRIIFPVIKQTTAINSSTIFRQSHIAYCSNYIPISWWLLHSKSLCLLVKSHFP